MTTTDWIQAISTVVLIGVTAYYAWRTHALSKSAKMQAEASVKMAEEMKKQRYDTVLPVIDIEILDVQKQANNQQSEAPLGSTFYELSFVFHNIGLGPAIAVTSATLTPAVIRLWDTLEAGGKTKKMSLSLKPKDGLLTLSVFYLDAYERKFESGRQVNIENRKFDWGIGPLIYCLREDGEQ